MKYKEIVLDARRLASAGAFIMAFVFEEDAEPVVIKGLKEQVTAYIKDHISIKALINTNRFRYGKVAYTHYHFNNQLLFARHYFHSDPHLYSFDLECEKPEFTKEPPKHHRRAVSNHTHTLTYRKFPHRWIPEWGKLMEESPCSYVREFKIGDVCAFKNMKNYRIWSMQTQPIVTNITNIRVPQVNYENIGMAYYSLSKAIQLVDIEMIVDGFKRSLTVDPRELYNIRYPKLTRANSYLIDNSAAQDALYGQGEKLDGKSGRLVTNLETWIPQH